MVVTSVESCYLNDSPIDRTRGLCYKECMLMSECILAEVNVSTVLSAMKFEIKLVNLEWRHWIFSTGGGKAIWMASCVN